MAILAAAAGVATTVELLGDAITVVQGILNIAASSQQVSDIISARIASGRKTWNDDERAVIEKALVDAKAYADAQIDAAEAAGR